MSHSTRIALGYLIAASLWVVGSDWLFAILFPDLFPLISLYKGWAFVLLSAVLLKVWVGSEERRRDQAEEQLRLMAIHDSLTGLLNRRAFVSHLTNALARARRAGTQLGLLYLDLDGFKAVNDTLGHAAGDMLLQSVAERLLTTLRNADTAARLGGDEFVVLADPDTRGGSEILAARLVEVFQQPFLLGEREVTISVSIGLSRFPDHGDTVDQLMDQADAAMYQVKKQGRNNYRIAGE